MTSVTIRYAGLGTYEWRANGSNDWARITLEQIQPQKYHYLINRCKDGGFVCFNYHIFNIANLILQVSNNKSEVGQN